MTLPLFAIDAAHSRDLDDAIAVAPRPDGQGWTVTVAVANVARAVAPGGELDHGARKLWFSRYSATRVRQSMLPAVLVEQQMSLSDTQARPAVVVTLVLGADGNVADVRVRCGRVQVTRLTHEQAWAAIDDASHAHHVPMLTAWELACLLLARRRRNGALAVYDARRGFVTDEEGRLVPFSNPHAHKAYIVVQELMILANQALSASFARAGLPLIYRNHQASQVADRQALLHDLDMAGAAGGGAGGAEYFAYVQNRMSLLLTRARHGAQVKGHYGLNLPAYAWFTSPLRRYADLVNQRLLLALLDIAPEQPYQSDELEAIATAINAAEDAARDATTDHFKQKAGSRAERQIARGIIAQASDQDMERIIKQVTLEGATLPVALAEELVLRILAGRLGEKELARLLLGRLPQAEVDGNADTGETEAEPEETDAAARARVHAAIRERLTANPHVASQIVNYATQGMGLAPVTVTASEKDMPSNVFVAVARSAFAGAAVCSAEQVATSKKEAGQRATVSLLMRLAGLPDPIYAAPSLPVVAQPAAPAAAERGVSPGVSPDAAKNLLNEFCQKRRLAMPVYTSSQSGPPHAPQFSATAIIDMDGRTLRSRAMTAASKKDAEKLAAADLLAQLAVPA